MPVSTEAILDLRSEDLLKFDEELAEICRRAGADSLVLREDQFHWAPKEGVWSFAQILEHLSITTNGYLPKILSALDEAERGIYGRAVPRFLDRLKTRFILSFEPPAKLRLPAPRQFQPSLSETKEKAEVLRTFVEAHEELRRLLRTAEGLEHERIIVCSPLSKLFRFSFRQCYVLLIVHGKRHLWQSEQLRARADFPK